MMRQRMKILNLLKNHFYIIKKIMKAIITNQLKKLRIVEQLTNMYLTLDVSKPIDVDWLSSRLTCDKNDLIDVLESMGVDIMEE